MDYRDHRPDTNHQLFVLLTAGVGLRQSSRILALSLSCTQLKSRKIARHLRRLNANLRSPLEGVVGLQFDELETYETRRSTRPLTVGILIHRDSRFLIAARAAPIRPSGPMPTRRRKAVAEDEMRFGRRQSRSRATVRSVLRRGAEIVRGASAVVLESDEKSTYPALARQVFGENRLIHERTSSKMPRHTWNPLFPINHTEAFARDLVSRLRRDSWLVSKRRWFLNLHLELFAAYRNYVRPRFNRDRKTPAELLGFIKRPLTIGRLMSWRQDWGPGSIHPLTV